MNRVGVYFTIEKELYLEFKERLKMNDETLRRFMRQTMIDYIGEKNAPIRKTMDKTKRKTA